ncbi:MAG TPA: M1 family peptidase, partial [Polyangia bacterium]|nr:M1 family peptidase [Polyangia bacterium]
MSRLGARGPLLLVLGLACARVPSQSAPRPSLPHATPPGLRLPEGPRPTSYALALRIDPDQATLTGTIDIELQLPVATSLLWLNATDIDVASAGLTFAGGTVPAGPTLGDRDFLGFAFRQPVGPGPAVLRVSYSAALSEREMAGAFRQKEGQAFYAYTQFEATDARRAFPCFDEPSFKIPWQLTLDVPDKALAFANTPQAAERALGAGTKRVTFAQTRPLPSY